MWKVNGTNLSVDKKSIKCKNKHIASSLSGSSMINARDSLRPCTQPMGNVSVCRLP